MKFSQAIFSRQSLSLDRLAQFLEEMMNKLVPAVNNIDFDQCKFPRHSFVGVSTAADGSYTITYDHVMANLPVVIPTLVSAANPILYIVSVESQTTAGCVIQIYDIATGAKAAAVAVINVWVMERR